MPDLADPEQGRLLRLALSLAGLLFFSILETRSGNRNSRHPAAPAGHATRNLALALCSFLLVILPCSGLILAAAEHSQTAATGLLRLAPATWQFPLGLMLLDFWTWSWHWCCHRIPILWRFHQVHHGDPAMDVTTAYRFHPGEILLSTLLRIPLIILLAIPLPTLLLYESILLASSQFQHSGLRCGKWEPLLGLLLVTPGLHRVHHARNPARTNSNFASVLSVWDRVFGTWRPAELQLRSGLPQLDDATLQSLSGLLRTPFVVGPAAGTLPAADPATAADPSAAGTKTQLPTDR